jgi:hypothetical protein
MTEEIKRYTQADIDELEAQAEELNRKIHEAKAHLRADLVDDLDAHYASVLPGMVVAAHTMFNDGTSEYLFIASTKVSLNYDMTRELTMYGAELRVRQEKVEYAESHISVSLDAEGRMVRVLFPGETEDPNSFYDYDIFTADELSKASGEVRRRIADAMDRHNNAHAENGKKTLEKFLRDVREKRKEMTREAGDDQVELA